MKTNLVEIREAFSVYNSRLASAIYFKPLLWERLSLMCLLSTFRDVWAVSSNGCGFDIWKAR